MLDRIWNSILDVTSKLVIPDWGSLIALLPVGLLVIVGLWLALTVRRFATAGPTRRGKHRITPRAPVGIHMPGPSFAPIFAAVGAFLVFFGLVVGGVALWLGVAALALTLLYWGREGLADYDHAVNAAPGLPAVVHEGPPPGVHMPGPSFRPILASIAVAVLFFGLVFGGWILVVGVAFVITTLLGWLRDARREYVKTVDADRTGHLETLPDPAWPRRLLWVFAILIVFAVVIDQGILPPRSNTAAGGGPGGSGAPPSGAPGGVPSAAAGDLTLVAEGIKFDTADLKAPAGKEFTVAFDNKDQGVPHDFAIRNDSGIVFKGETVTGPGQTVDKVPALQPGSYTFFCTFHANMTGTLTAG